MFTMILILGAAAGAPPAEPPMPKDAAADARWQELYRRHVAQYELRLETEPPQPLTLRAEPIMHWVSINDYNGDVFVWTRGKRPEAIGAIFSSGRPQTVGRFVMHEFRSLSESPLALRRGDDRKWSTSAGLDMQPLPEAPPPATSDRLRLLQMKALAREFTAHMQHQGGRWELRLVNQPLYHYTGDGKQVLGGAIFAFVGFVTDPEVLLLLEARPSAAGGARWFYAPLRFSNRDLWVEYRSKPLWKSLVDRNRQSNDPLYILFGSQRIPTPDIEPKTTEPPR